MAELSVDEKSTLPWFAALCNLVLVIIIVFFVIAGETAFLFHEHVKSATERALSRDRPRDATARYTSARGTDLGRGNPGEGAAFYFTLKQNGKGDCL